jgi:hypothetical protein
MLVVNAGSVAVVGRGSARCGRAAGVGFGDGLGETVGLGVGVGVNATGRAEEAQAASTTPHATIIQGLVLRNFAYTTAPS